MTLKDQAPIYFRTLQEEILAKFLALDRKAEVTRDEWNGSDRALGGGGRTIVLANGTIFEKGGINFSAVNGQLPAEMCQRLVGSSTAQPFSATGISMVIHPFSPMVPTTHFNLRYLEVADKCWFGGGSDLTPYYLFNEDAVHFHTCLKAACDRHDSSYYPRFKEWCDQYFHLPHRGERRGVGGIFFDYLGRDGTPTAETFFPFIKDVGEAIASAYLPIVEQRHRLPFSSAQKEWQLYRRGRYVEFNLLYDLGTRFGLSTGGRTESILMSMPPEVRWGYNQTPNADSPEAALLQVLREPRAWITP